MTEAEEIELTRSESAAAAALYEARGSDAAWMAVAKQACAHFGLRLSQKNGRARLSTDWNNAEEVIAYFEARGIQTSDRDGKVSRRLG